MGATPSFEHSPNDTIESKLAKTGGNTGNQLIAYGLLRALDYETVSWDYSLGPAYVDANFDIIVIAAANFLFPGFDFSGMANFIAATKLPCLMVGVGAQSPDYSLDIPLQPGTLRLMQLVSERSACIGVRGPYTADVLARKGIKNVQVVGCPSYYMRLSPTLPEFRRPTDGPLRVAINGSRDVVKHSFHPEQMIHCLRALIQQAITRNYDFITQTEIDELYCSLTSSNVLHTDFFLRVSSFYRGVCATDDLLSWLRGNVRVFWDVHEWLTSMANYDFVLGTRFHGAIAAIQRKVPALVICHDSRTEEMCTVMGLPHRRLAMSSDWRISTLFDEIDMSVTRSTYVQRYALYIDFLDYNDVGHLLGVRANSRASTPASR